jgi:molecular chaperone GrpE
VTAPLGGASQGPAAEREEVAPHIVDKRRVDPETFQVREPDLEPGADRAPAADATPSPSSDAALAEAQALAAERLDQLQRAQADLYNLDQRYNAYVKRTRGELAAATDRGAAALAEALIPVLDDVELARRHGELTGPFQSVAEKLEATLERFGVERYGAAGEPFDPAVHEALMHGHSDDVSEPTVQEVIQPGYRTAERVLRAARVAVVDPDGPQA